MSEHDEQAWRTWAERTASGLADTTPPDWRALALELAEAAELAANNTLAVVGREPPKTRPRSVATLAVEIARTSTLAALDLAQRVREAAT
jgi:hypothetical protein